MAVDVKSTLTMKTRDEDRDQWLADYKLRLPTAEVGKDTEPFITGSVDADARAPTYANAQKLADATTWLNSRGTKLTEFAKELGRERRPAVGGIGYVIIKASLGGGEIIAGTSSAELKNQPKGTKFTVVESGTYQNGQLCAVQGLDVGPDSNVPAGTVLTWTSPASGILGTCTVFQNADGSGITGGADEESDEDLLGALIDLHANPASSGNDAEVIQYAERLQGIAIQKVFCFPCVGGPGEYAIAFTMRPSVPGASRLPNGAQIAKVLAELTAKFPGDDGIMVATGLDQLFAPCLKVSWKSAVAAFADQVPWPPYASSKVTVMASPAPTASTCRVNNCTTVPTAGKNIAFYDSSTRTFANKRILTATLASGSNYDLVFDMVGTASHPSFIPASGAIVSPWCTAIATVVEPLLLYSDKQGPGEMVASFIDPGRRQRRVPEPGPGSWPSKVGNDILDDVFDLVADAVLMEPTTPFATTVGMPGLTFYLHRISDIGIFAL